MTGPGNWAAGRQLSEVIMIGVSSRISASFSKDYTVDLFQSASVSQRNGHGHHSASANISSHHEAGAASRAIDSIMSIIMQSNGDTSVDIATDGNVNGVRTDSGNDDISVVAARAYGIGSGAGNDTIEVASKGATVGVFGGEGNDTIDIDAGGNVGLIAGGDGNDTINIESDGMVAFVNGGYGNDTINIEADRIELVTGGSGNDTVNITNNGDRNAQYYYFEGDGNDTITSNGPVEINFFSEDGTSRQDVADATWETNGNSVTISFLDGGSITVEMEDAENASVTYDADKGSLVISPAADADAGAAEALKSLE